MPSSSSWKVVKQKEHKERNQPQHRARLGLLEKHKDYVLRAKDYNQKKTRLKKLKEQAYFRNPDEFYFKMIEKKEGNQYTHDALQLMKTQDIGYITVKKTAEMKKIDKLQDGLHLLSSKPNTHTIFVDSKEEAESFDPVGNLVYLKGSSASEYFDTVPEALERNYNRPKKELMEKEDLFVNNAHLGKVEKERNRTYTELLARIDRDKKLEGVLENMHLQKQLMGKGRRIKINKGEGKPPVFKWKRERRK